MKILFLMDSPEYLRFYDSAVEELASRGHSLTLAVNSSRTRKPVGLEGLQAYADRVQLLGVVPGPDGPWGAVAHDLRATMDFVRFLHPQFAASRVLRARIKRKVLSRAYHWLDLIPRLSPASVGRVEGLLAAMEHAIPVCAPVADFLQEQAPDVLLVSPLVAAASEQVDWIKAARRLGIRTAVCIASWDNLTNKGLLRIEPDLVLVWNEAQRREAHEYHYVPAEKITVTGAQLFDKWFVKTATRDRDAFCRRVGLPDDSPFLLFVGSSSFISESSAEVAFVRRWIQAVRESTDPALREANILVRPHPYNCHRWESDPTADLGCVAVFPRRGYNPIDPDHRDDYYDSLFHCAAVVGVNTSAMIEAAIVGRPVLSMLVEEFAGTQEGTIHFHHLLPENGGCVRIASTLDEHIEQLRERMQAPASVRVETARFIASFVRPHGKDRPATPIFADTVEGLGAAPAPRPEAAPVWSYALRPVVIAAALPAAVVRGFGTPDSRKLARKRTLGTVRRARRALRKRVTDAGRRVRRAARGAGKRLHRSLVKRQRAKVKA